MDKKIRYLNFVKQSIRDNTFNISDPKWSYSSRYRVGGVMPLNEETIHSIYIALSVNVLFDGVYVSKEIMNVFFKRVGTYYGIKTKQEFTYVIQGYYQWFLEEKDNLKHGVQR
jgi:hypothetical protein